MTDPVTLTVGAIATLAFTEFLKSGAGDLGKQFTQAAIAKMKQLRELIAQKLRGEPEAEQAMVAVEQQGSQTDLDDVAAFLRVAMKKDPQFAEQVRVLAQEINAGKLIDQSNMTQNIHDQAKGWQAKVEGGTAYIGEIHIQGKPE